MTITIGSFSASTLLAQPIGYEGDARDGFTARTFTVSGLLTPAQWQALISEYDTWRSTRLADQDTLLSESVGTTVSLSISNVNGLSVSNLACWFIEAPRGDQTGAYVSAQATLVNATDALAVLLRERDKAKERQIAEAQDVSCAVVTANLERRKDETDCEIAALSGGLAQDFALQDIQRGRIEAEAKATAATAQTTALAATKTAEATAELKDKQAQHTGRASSAASIATADLNLEAQQATAKATAYGAGGTALQAIQAAAISTELAEGAARIAALNSGGTLNSLRDSRGLLALYDKYLGEDLPDLGTVTLGSATVKLLKPMETFGDGPSVAMTATGISYVTGPLAAHEMRQVEGIITSGTYADVRSWYSTTISTVPAAGTWFPTSAPSATAEAFLVSGVKGTRYTVSVEVKKIL